MKGINNMKKLLSVLCLAALMVSVICLMTIGISATDAPATTATTTAAETMSDAQLAQWIANKYNVTLDEAYKAADDMIGLADATLGADNVLTKLIITLKNNPVLLVVVFVSVSALLGGAVLYIKSRFHQSKTENMLMKDYIEPSKNSFDLTAANMASVEIKLASYESTINEAKRLAEQSAENTARIKALTEQNITAEKQRTEAYTSEMKSSVLFAATISKLLQVVDIPAGRKDAIMNCFVTGLNSIETLSTDPTILAAIAEIKKETK